MKLIWRIILELKSNKFSTLLLIMELIFSMICYQLCFVLTESFINSTIFFQKNYNNNSIKVYADGLSKEQTESLTSAADAEDQFSVDFYYCESEGGLFINSASESAFDIAKPFCTEGYVDTDKDYGGAIPCLTSPAMASAYSTGKTYNIDGTDYYICGHLTNNNIYYMSDTATGSAYILAYDKDDIIANSMSQKINSCLFIKTSSDSLEQTEAISAKLDKFDYVDESSVFDWKSSLKQEFRTVSGILIIGVWVAIISIIGILANNYLTYKKNEKNYCSQMCIGARRKDIIILYIFRLSLSILVSVPFTMVISKYVFRSMGVEITSYSSIGIAIAIVLVITGISLTAIFRHLRKAALY